MFRAEPAALAPVSEAEADALQLAEACASFAVTDSETYEQAQQALLDLGPRIKHVEGLQKAAKDAVKVLLAPYERPLKAYQTLKVFLKDQILGYERAERAKAELAEREAARLLAAAREAEQDSPEVQAAQEQAHALVVASALQPERAKGIGRTYTYRAEIVDPNLVPDDFWVIDAGALNALARTTKGSAEVPGVRFLVIEGVRA